MDTRTVSGTPSTLGSDVSAGLVVFLVALPLCLGVALASNAPLFSGLLAGIVGGIVVGVISHSHTSVSGPAAGLTAVVAAQIAALGSFEAFLGAVVLAGILQIGLGIARAGSIADFVPSSVIKGLLSAIGLILVLKQIPHLFGRDTDPVGEMSFQQPDQHNTFSGIGNILLGLDIHWSAAVIGVFSILLLLLWDRTKVLKGSLIPGPLAVVLFGVAANLLFVQLGGAWVIQPSHLVQVPVANDFAGLFGFLQLPDVSALSDPKVYAAAVTIALVASLETLLNLEAIDKLDPQRRVSPPNRELIAQGIGNITAGLIGALPVTSVIVRSSVNISAGGQTKRATILHGTLLLVCVALLPTWLNLIPLSALAAVLIMTGFKLASPQLFLDMWRRGYEQFLPFIVTVTAILLTDLLIGIVIGLVFSVLFILRSNLRRPLRRTLEKHVGDDVLHIELAHQVSFLNRVALRNALEEVPPGGHVLIDARDSDYIDADVLALIREYEQEMAPARGVNVSLVGFKPHYEQLEDRVEYVDCATRELQESLTPDQVIEILRAGNQRFCDGRMLTRDLKRLREEVADGRHPLAVVLSGSSSRTPVELIFDAGPGEIFCTRVTGNVAKPGTIGSLEYACAVAGAKVIIVLGHSDNKAVRLSLEVAATCSAPAAEDCLHLSVIVSEIQKSIEGSVIEKWMAGSPEMQRALVDEVSRRHVARTLAVITNESPVLRKLTASGLVKLVGAMYDVHSGAVAFLGGQDSNSGVGP